MADIKTVKDLIPDNHNANKGTARGLRMVEASLQEDGFGRPVLVDKNGKLIAGNKTVESVAQTFGIDTEVVLVKTTGNKVIVHQREDLDLDDLKGSARRLAYRDNLSSHFSFTLEPEVVLADFEAGFDFEGIGLQVEDLATLLPDVTEFGGNENAGNLSANEKVINSEFMIIIECETEQDQTELLDRFIGEGLNCRALLS